MPALWNRTMADEADDAPPPPPKKSGGFMGTLMNGLGIFALTLVAVVVGGFINAKLHPLPDLKLDKDGKITAIVPVAAAAKGAEGGGSRQAVGLLRHRSAPGREFRGRLRGALPANHHGNHGARRESHRERAKEHSVDPQQFAAADEQSQLPIDDVARRQGKTARRKRSPKYAPCRRRKAVPTWTMCCSPASWCSDGGKPGTHLQRRSGGPARKERQGSRRDGASVRFRRAAHQSDPVARCSK